MSKTAKKALRGWSRSKLLFLSSLLLLFACKGEGNGQADGPASRSKEKAKTLKPLPSPAFNADSAYAFVQKQVDYGPRVPGSKAHAQCASFLEQKLKTFGFQTQLQTGKVTTFNNKVLDLKNIIGAYRPEQEKRILLFAHWDTRPFADRDSKKQSQPIDGANDGASGVGVLLEIARQVSLQQPKIGVDIIFFDAEDYGQPRESMMKPKPDTWCLGSQYWSQNRHRENYSARYGILLDMVGAKDAVFPLEGTSMYFAPAIMKTVWNNADRLGYGNYFVNITTGPTTDDHLYVNRNTGIPSICIVHYNPQRQDYGKFHHRHSDNMDIISKKTLRAVGETVLATVLSETKKDKGL